MFCIISLTEQDNSYGFLVAVAKTILIRDSDNTTERFKYIWLIISIMKAKSLSELNRDEGFASFDSEFSHHHF